MSTPIFRFENVYLEKENKTILENINLEIYPNEFFVILGENGSGKSSLLKLFNRLEINTKGKIFFKDRPIEEIPIHELRERVIMILQGATLFEGKVKNVLETYIEKLKLKYTPKQILDIMGLDYSNLEKKTENLSGGEGQLIAISLAIAKDPEVLLLDEITSALSITMGALVRKKMKELQKQGKTIICITHNMENAVEVGERGVFLKDGQIVKMGKIKELIECFGKDESQCTKR
ncbi:ABC transport system ATP-binding protein [Thermotomaculum hydrothermale]|uniref:ABC transport system ATP-binding protein n=1 Tax=Thermotomaculum hydrothermale TaxID=981385 RepID=A0A7R6PY76_9BACT|nr:ATP-binding cassette domain-containing protein [Thermotomaculum hydrothermale]BBB33005.1 ABC transport system ATP-binding protein [Thermotomaculum hydrothermale]